MATDIALLIPLAGIGMVTFLGYTKIKQRAGAGNADAARLETVVREMAGDMEKLRERVQVLEKLATDGDRNLANEIERLRGRPDASPRGG